MKYELSDIEKYIVKPENISPSCIEKHQAIQMFFGNDFISLETWISSVQEEQRTSLKRWINYVNQENISEDQKEWIISNILKIAYYDRKKQEFRKRNIHSIHPFIELNQKVVENTLFNQKEVSFRLGYKKELVKMLNRRGKEGVWKIYTSPDQASEVAEDLQGWFTNWCINTYSAAYLHLLAGELHIYYERIENLLYPRIAIGVENKGRIRCVGLEENQRVEEDLNNVLSHHLKKHIF